MKMKQKTALLKFSLCFIILFSLLSTIISFQKIPCWNNATINVSDLPNDLNNSEIIDYTINNHTNGKYNILYSIVENDIYYLYINGTKYQHNYKEDLKYFTSPLIEYNNEYYFCASLKNIIKINSSGNLEEIQNQQCLNDYLDYELKCYYHYDKNIILVAFINTPFVNSYDLNNNQWLKEKPHELEIDNNNIIDTNAYNVEVGDNKFYLGIFFKNESKNFFVAATYFHQLDLARHYKIIFEGKVYSKSIVSFGEWDSTPIGYIFTYEPKELNTYNFFYIKIRATNCLVNNGSYYLTLFREAEIYDAFFVENSPVLVYFIRKREKDSTSNFYLGAVDINSFVIIYNVKIDKEKKVYFDNGYLYKNKGFLRLFENGSQKRICPFIYDSNKDSCKLLLDDNQYFYIVESSGENNNTIIDKCPEDGEIVKKYCLKECPNGFGKNNQRCVLCLTENVAFYMYHTQECVTYIKEEDSNYPYDGNIYYDCNDLKYFGYNCYDDCSEIYGISKDNQNECATCESYNQIFDNYECVYSCNKTGIGQVSMELNGINYTFCHNCSEIGKYYYDGKCYDKCPLEEQVYDSDNICFICSDRFKDKIYNLNGECVEGCSKGNQTFIINGKLDCYNCKEHNQYFLHNKTCQNECEIFSLYDNETNICYFCNETDLQYYEDGQCVKECSFMFGLEDYGICKNCSEIEERKLYKEGKCVSTCGTYINDNGLCKTCPNDTLFFEYDCFPECPNYTIQMPGNYCLYCHDKFQEGRCVDECSKGYVVNKTKIKEKHIDVEICLTCDSFNNTWFNGIDCVEYCPITKYASDDNFCRLCFCGFSAYNCNKTSDKCICNNTNVNGEIFGDNCEFFTKRKNNTKILSIEPHAPIISSKKAVFSYNLKDYNNENYNYSIRWRVFVDENEITDTQYFATGVNERIFIVNSGVFQPGEIKNEVYLEVNISDKIDLKVINILNDSLSISIQSIKQNREIFLESVEGINTVMDNKFILNAENLAGIQEYKFYYRLLIKDEHNEIIPIKQRKDLDPLIDKQNQKIHFMLPKFKNFLFEISNIREEKYIATNIEKKNENSNMEYKLDDILNYTVSSIISSYNDIEIIFLIMKYLDINKNNDLNISQKEYEQILNFIDDKLTLVAKENGAYQGPEPEIKENKTENSIRYYINYYEPKTIFSLMNKIFLSQETKIPNECFDKIVIIFKEFFNILLKNNYEKKLDNSDILSFFRTFDHFIEIYVNKQKSDNNYIINKADVLEILNKLTEYLISQVYPGETIRLVGKKVSLFLSRFGEYQNHLSFSSTNNISEKLKYDDYNTFTYYDYNINQEKCDDDGNTLLCIENGQYEIFKENISDIHNYCLSLIAINNNNDKFAQNENEGNTFKMNLINYINNDKINNTSLFYDIEFPFYYVHSSSKNHQKIFIEDINSNTERDYRNITCVPKNNLYNDDYYCLTYFNYDTNVIKCSCNIMDEITYISNYKAANFYKEIQTKGKFKTYGYFNKFSLYGFFGILAIILIPNFCYLIYEIKNDIKKAEYKLLSYTQKIKDSYLQVKALNNTSICSFSILAFIYKFPYLSPLRRCNLQTPKYIKHFIIILSIAYGMGTNLLLFLIYYPFKEKQEIIDKRDIKNKNFEVIDEHIISKYLNKSAIFSLFGLIVSGILYYIFSKVLSFNTDERKYWKHMKTIFSNYVSNKIKNEVLLGPTWNKIKLRIIAYYNLCGQFILSKKLKKKSKTNKNFENYLTTSQAKRRDTEEMLLPLDAEGEMTELKDKTNKVGKYRSPSINNQKENIKNNHFKVGAINDSGDDSININANVVKIIKSVHTDNFQLYGSKNKADKLIEKNKKFERIKNKYICKKSIKNSIEDEIESGSRSCSFDFINFYKELEIEYVNNISFLPTDEYIISESIKKKQIRKGKSSTVSISSTHHPEGYWSIFIANFVLAILLIIYVIVMFKYIKSLLNDFGSFIINIWIGSSIFIYLLAYPILYYIKIFIGSFLLFKCYYIKNKLIGKILYWIFVDKTMIHIFKVRNYITKYKKELDY